MFRYSDETAEAVTSGEKLLKESGTIYESFADMMSPEDAKRYLDFLENGSREGLTGAAQPRQREQQPIEVPPLPSVPSVPRSYALC